MKKRTFLLTLLAPFMPSVAVPAERASAEPKTTEPKTFKWRELRTSIEIDPEELRRQACFTEEEMRRAGQAALESYLKAKSLL